MPSLTLSKLRSLFKLAALTALTASCLVAINALSAPADKPAKARAARIHAHRAFKQVLPAPTAGAIVLIGETRTVSPEPGWLGTDWDGNGMDSVELQCPEGRQAISGGFEAPDSAGVLLNGSHPGSGADRWVVEITYFGDGQPADWIPNVTCI